MWSTKQKLLTSKPASHIWNTYTNVDQWHKWDNHLRWAKLDGEFKTGAKGTLQPQGGPVVAFEVKEAIINQRLWDRRSLPLVTIDVIRSLSSQPDGTLITHELRIDGPLAFLFVQVIGKPVAKTLPAALKMLVEQ